MDTITVVLWNGNTAQPAWVSRQTTGCNSNHGKTPTRQEQRTRSLGRCMISQPSILCDLTIPNGARVARPRLPSTHISQQSSARIRRTRPALSPHTAQAANGETSKKKPNGWRLCKPGLPWVQWAPTAPIAPMAGIVTTRSLTAQTRSEDTILVQTRGDPGHAKTGPPGYNSA